jgi:ligand-binding sensor domain-containing protein/signal transduction histidine kinase
MPKKSRAFRFARPLLCVFGVALSAVASPVAGSDTPFIVDSWSNEEGLPQSSVISVIQSKDGYLWLGTLNGLVRFDGKQFTVFNEMNTPGLTSDRIVFLFEDSKTNLWVGTESSGLEMIKNGAVTNFSAETSGGGRTVTYANEDSSGDILFYTGLGIFSYHDGQVNFYPGYASPQLFSLAQRIVVPSASGGYWRILNGMVEKFRDGRLEKNFEPAPWGGGIVKAALEDDKGNLIVGTFGAGIFWQDAGGAWQNISINQGLSSRFVLSLCLDREGNLWVGTDGDGLDRIKRKAFDTPGELHPWDAQSLSADNHGGLWVAYNFHGLSYWLTNSVSDFGVGQYSNAWTVLMDAQQNVWAGTRDEGLFLFRTNHFDPAPGAGILGKQITALFEDRRGQLWVGAQNGLALWNGRDWKIYTTRDGLSGNAVCAIAEDADGNLWIGTDNQGLNFFKDGKFVSQHASENRLPGDDISCLYADKDGVLWIGTGGHGLARLENGRWARYASTNGLASDSISYITEDDAGYLWIGSNVGLMRIPKKSLNDFAASTTNVISCRTYGKADGLPTRECSVGSQPSACRTADGKLWLPTVKGVASLNPSELKPNLQPPPVMIESVLVNGREQKTNRLDSAWQPSIIIPPGGEELEIHYTALNFSAPGLVRFKCWLEGHETAPTDVGGERIARYPKLPPGHYRFHVEACNEDNVWSSPDTAVLAVTVQPQFWQTNGFRVAAIILFLGIVVAIVRYISTQKLQRQLQSLQQREALEKERARIARDLHDQLGANLTQVALLGEMAEADKDSPAEIESHAQQISQTARETTRSLDEIVWAVNPANDTLEGLANYAGKYAQEYLALAGVRYRADLSAQLPAVPIPPEVRHNVFLAFKEAVHNVVKHAQASEVWIRLRLQPGNFILEIEDNGCGMGNQPAPQNRNGLRNMKKRMEDIRGEFSISGGASGGTIVRLTIPISKLS